MIASDRGTHTRQQLIDVLTALSSQTRAIIVERLCHGTLRHRVVSFFYEVHRMRETLLEERFGPLVLRRELDALLTGCVGPLVRLRPPLLRAARLCDGMASLMGSDRCPCCATKLEPPHRTCRGCGAPI